MTGFDGGKGSVKKNSCYMEINCYRMRFGNFYNRKPDLLVKVFRSLDLLKMTFLCSVSSKILVLNLNIFNKTKKLLQTTIC